ncbi:cobyrinate a,c-diamide synthase [Actinacidiphila bryophytorum]|uniref:Hydrogenobyrinate a,c-diamide synthase n=1 Tax=Actinacidiphila bryophytorum TaxID=1436133 RepID=A0A9W4GZT3_9ACTN|nr:cobyrinate a,c-diamide synthase [Actinacidiphila bryophytorum]MBM9436105.1 cobyrinate a,c-diamide synthase [Actinacidiphila bryophytorum]CAG7634277.1 Hydrogenobyrinate a,c-diamide synthase [Actinacidiphila bryophytorum]
MVARLVIAAPASGSGKTTVATGLMAAFADAGLAVSGHKVGPDYIDPGYHALATGRPGRNLDPYLCGPQRIAPLFLHGAAGCGLAVVEGVMGLFDGASGHGELASTAQVATLLRAPVVLVVDASAQARSVAALVHGFASFDPRVRVGGVVLNKVGSARHEDVLRGALDEVGVPCLGVLRRGDDLVVPSRHLGLVPAAERLAAARHFVRAAAARVRTACDLPALLSLARTAPPLQEPPWNPASELASGGLPHPAPSRIRGSAPDPGPRQQTQPVRRLRTRRGVDAGAAGPVVAVAAGAAFTFRYAENMELLTAAGAQVVEFDPLRDESLPEGTSGLILGGGFPELHAAELSANSALREEIRTLDAPVAAECAGLLYLSRALDGESMCGRLPVTATMTGRLTLGYREAVALSDSPLAAQGTRLRGHEFHRTAVDPARGAAPAWGFTHPERRTEGFTDGSVHASYLHLHWAAEPSLATRFVERCAAWTCV